MKDGIHPEGYEIKRKQTNADRIRSMNDEELAEFFEKLEVVCDMCAFKVGCCNIVSGNCKSGLLKWLQSEVEGVTENE